MKPTHQLATPAKQSGAVLLVAVVLLLLAGVMTLLALNVGVFEQRSTANDVRAKAVKEVAEAGLAQGFEYLMRQNRGMLTNTALWEKCGAADVTFPCGAISTDLVDTNEDGNPDTPRRNTMYRLISKGDTIAGLDPKLANYMLPLDAGAKLTTTSGGSAVVYGVAPVMCFIKAPSQPDPPPPAPPTPVLCGDGTGVGATDLRAVTFVSVAKMPGESASSTLTQTIGEYPKLRSPLGVPPITASGSAGISGTLQVVTNPNAGGAGVPVSVWTRLDVQKTGTTNTCYADEFFRYTQGSVSPEPYQGTIRCDKCQCDVNGAPATLSYDNSGNEQIEGIDILDVEDGTNSQSALGVLPHKGANYNVRADVLSYPICEFPPDLFEYIFGVPTWQDTNSPQDCFNETKRASVTYQNPDNGTSATIGPDQAYLYKNADKIIPTGANAGLVQAGKLGTSALLSSPAASGIIWCQQSCDIGSGTQMGTPAAPVVLVVDGSMTIHGTFFGLIFIRDTGSLLDPTTGSSVSGNCPPIANCALKMQAGAAVYGAIVMQGQMTVQGTSAVIHDETVLKGIGGTSDPIAATLPGAWNDQRSY